MSHSKSKSPKDQNVSSYKRCLAIGKVRWRGSLAEQGEVDGGGGGHKSLCQSIYEVIRNGRHSIFT